MFGSEADRGVGRAVCSVTGLSQNIMGSVLSEGLHRGPGILLGPSGDLLMKVLFGWAKLAT